MSQAYRNLQETQLLALRALERRVANIERAASGQVSIQSVASGATAIVATGPPGTTVSGPSITIVQPGRYAILAVFDFSGSVTGWTAASGAILKNGAETTPNLRAVLRDTGTATGEGTQPTFQFQTLSAGDVITLGAWKSAAGGTVAVNANTHVELWRTGPT